ncbi:MAG: multiheme c-type cytochrome [Thermoanaerobaculia bacterium]
MNISRNPHRAPGRRAQSISIPGWFALILLLGSGSVPAALAQMTPAAETPVLKEGMYVGPVSCAASGCHGSPAPVEGAKVLMNEYDTWLHAPSPTHVHAWEVLLQPLSRRIAKNLGLEQPPEKSSVCIACHSMNVPQNLQATTGALEIADGVSCEGCHGPAGGWLAGHTSDGWSHADSVAKGMTDLKDLPTRARTCLGCHMGNDSREVNHDMIASGHPILNFELDNFSGSPLMPNHWKPDPARDGVPAWAVGQVVAQREEAANLVRHANGPQWPEFTHMSCASCHHPLREGEWRQERGYRYRPGMPLRSQARWLVLRHIVETAAPQESAPLTEEMAQLSDAVGRMKDRARIAELAGAVEGRLDRVLPAVQAKNWTDADVRKMVGLIAGDADRYEIADRQSAEQATLALISLVSQLDRSSRGSMSGTVDQLYQLLQRLRYPDEYDRKEFASTLRTLLKPSTAPVG